MVHQWVVLSGLFLSVAWAQAQTVPYPPVFQNQTENLAAGQYQHPVLPSLRVSEDGRVGVSITTPGSIRFYLNVPEKITTNFLDSAPGVHILANNGDPFTKPESFVNSGWSGEMEFATICDPTTEFDFNATTTNNPRICGNDNELDCYDLELYTMVRPSTGSTRMELHQTPITVQVVNPKTINARINAVWRRNPAFLGATFQGAEAFFEPMVGGKDKRLLVGRIDESRLSWPKNGSTVTDRYDIVYSHSTRSTPCDSRGFQQLFPISHAPYDSSINNKYGFAKNEFRDTKGIAIPDGKDLGGTYPWIDRHANNITFMGVRSKLFNYHSASGTVKTRYPAQCVSGVSCTTPTSQQQINTFEANGKVGSYFIMGLWTNGKMVLMDTTIQGTDYGLGASDSKQREINLYRTGSGVDRWVRAGTGRDKQRSDLDSLKGHPYNTSLFESIENRFNMLENFKPRSPRDVVWLISSPQRTDEFAFDDYLSHKVLINSPMNAAVEWQEQNPGPAEIWLGQARLLPKDGFHETHKDLRLRVQLQNAATTKNWNTPTNGYMTGTNAGLGRIEPVSQGGVHGKGFFTYYNQGIVYHIPSQPRTTTGRYWYTGFFLDSRIYNDNTDREILRFPNGDKIYLKGRKAVVFQKSGQGKTTVNLQTPLPWAQWAHLGLLIGPRGQWIGIKVNGFPMASYNSPNTVAGFEINPGALRFAFGIRGWVDEFKVMEGWYNHEHMCNIAGGSLQALTTSYPDTGWWKANIADKYPDSQHRAIYNALSSRSSDSRLFATQKYVCRVDYTQHKGANTKFVPANMFSVKDIFHFNEGPLVFNQPRPDSRTNGFCLSCHSDTLQQGLRINALAPGSGTQMQNDRRRQPMQALRRVFGNIPANFLHNSSPWQPGAWGVGTDESQHPD